MGFVVKKAGLCTTVQDRGRFGYQGSGFSPSGVMDRHAAALANILVENDQNAPVIEFALTGPTLRFTTNSIIAITGGNFSPMLGGKPAPMYKALSVHRGSVLSFGAPCDGVYGYLAIAGGSVDIPEVMGSYSTNMKCGVGGWKGRKLIPGDYLPFKTKNVEFLPNIKSHHVERGDFYNFDAEVTTIRVVMGPQEDAFTPEGIETFFSSTYTLTNQCDRMGYRIEGPGIETVAGSDIISDGIPFGAIQVPSHGRILIMLVDRQTTGGYAKIATIASVDIPKMVQRRPGDKVRFVPISVGEAQALLRAEDAYYKSLAKQVKRISAGGISPRRTARRLTPILEEQAKQNVNEQLWIDRK